MLKNIQVAAFNLRLLAHYQPYGNKTWQIYVCINVQVSCQILQN